MAITTVSKTVILGSSPSTPASQIYCLFYRCFCSSIIILRMFNFFNKNKLEINIGKDLVVVVLKDKNDNTLQQFNLSFDKDDLLDGDEFIQLVNKILTQAKSFPDVIRDVYVRMEGLSELKIKEKIDKTKQKTELERLKYKLLELNKNKFNKEDVLFDWKMNSNGEEMKVMMMPRRIIEGLINLCDREGFRLKYFGDKDR